MYACSLYRAQVILRTVTTQGSVYTRVQFPVTISRTANVMFSSAAAHANPGPANGWYEGPNEQKEKSL